MKISIIGAGYVGLVNATCFAELGHTVNCIDIDKSKIEILKSKKTPIYEAGLNKILEKNIDNKRLSFNDNFENIQESEIIFLAVGTPSDENGNANLESLYNALNKLKDLISPEVILVIKSTVPLGTADKVFKLLKGKFSIVSNPEFLREGSAVYDFLNPDRIIIGSHDKKSAQTVRSLYEKIIEKGAKVFCMSNISAEITKYAANTFLASKICFINEVARLCDQVGADIFEVKDGLASDLRIGDKFLNPGPGYGGSCFPKDVKAFVNSAKEYNADLDLVFSIGTSNDRHKEYIQEKIKTYFNDDLKNKTISFWGVAYKANTDDVRQSPALNLANFILKKGGKVKFFDSLASKKFLNTMEDNNNLIESKDMYQALEESDSLVIITESKDFSNPNFEKIKAKMKNPVIFDFRNLYSRKEAQRFGINYIAIGRS